MFVVLYCLSPFFVGASLGSWGVLLYGLSWYGRANVRTHFGLCVIFMELLSKEI